MKIAAVSDTHGMLDQAKAFPPADVLVIAGDYCPNFRYRGAEKEDAKLQVDWLKEKFSPFLKTLQAEAGYKKILVVAGNHDWCHFYEETQAQAREALEGADTKVCYLQDEFYEYGIPHIDGVKFYGAPWQPHFFDWAFNLPEHDYHLDYPAARRIWDKIPNDTDVLITHGPPRGWLDRCPDGRTVGCPVLAERVIWEIKPQLHLFGHIHDSYGSRTFESERLLGLLPSKKITFGNVALCDESYDPVNPIQVFEV